MAFLGKKQSLIIYPVAGVPSFVSETRNERYRQIRKQALVTFYWLILIILTFYLVFHFTTNRDDLVAEFPALSKIYRIAQLDVDDKFNVSAFKIDNIKFSVQFRNQERILHLSGNIINTSANSEFIPPLMLSLNNVYGAQDYTVRVRFDDRILGAKQTEPFSHTIFDFKSTSSDIVLLFLNRSEDLYTKISLNNIPAIDQTQKPN